MLAKKRKYGDQIGFRSLVRAPVNEHGVVYLIGVLHDLLGLEVESIQAGFPDSVAKRKTGKGTWEELRIEFESCSRSFLTYGHDPTGADMIVCWEHDWPGCPAETEVLELRSFLPAAEGTTEEIRTERQLSEYQKFSQTLRIEGKSFAEIATLWKARKSQQKNQKPKAKGRLSEWQQFCQEKRKEGLAFDEIGKAWRAQKRASSTPMKLPSTGRQCIRERGRITEKRTFAAAGR